MIVAVMSRAPSRERQFKLLGHRLVLVNKLYKSKMEVLTPPFVKVTAPRSLNPAVIILTS